MSYVGGEQVPSAPGLSGRARGADKAGPTRLRIHETEVSSSIVENIAMDVCDAAFQIEGASSEDVEDRLFISRWKAGRKLRERDANYIPRQLQSPIVEARESSDIVIDS